MTVVIHTANHQWNRNKLFQTCSLLTAGQQNCLPEAGIAVLSHGVVALKSSLRRVP